MVLLDVSQRTGTRGSERPIRIAEQPAPVARPAETVGATLRAARLSRGWDIDEIVRRTALSPRVLRSMEADDFSACGGECYARGHLRILARALSLDEEATVAAVPLPGPAASEQEEQPPSREGFMVPQVAVLALAAVVALTVSLLLLVR